MKFTDHTTDTGNVIYLLVLIFHSKSNRFAAAEKITDAINILFSVFLSNSGSEEFTAIISSITLPDVIM